MEQLKIKKKRNTIKQSFFSGIKKTILFYSKNLSIYQVCVNGNQCK